MKHQGIAVGRSLPLILTLALLAAAFLPTAIGWTQETDAKTREERLKRASGLAGPGEETPAPRPGAPSVSPPVEGREIQEMESRRESHAGEAKAVVTKAYLNAIVQASDHSTTREIEAPEKRSLPGTVIKLNTPIEGEIYLPAGWKASGSSIDVLVHFHGAPWMVEENAEAAGLNCVVLALNPGGRGGQYASTFSNPEVFEYILDVALQQLRKENLIGADAQWGRVALSAFSAGYGAIREILNTAQFFNKVDAIALADALHASFADESTSGTRSRELDPEQMRPFVEFARLAAEGKKALIVSRSSVLPVYYSGTPETVAYLIHEVGGREEPVKPPHPDTTGMTLIMRFDKGDFHVRGYAGIGAADHMEHFYTLSALFKQLPLPKKS